MRISFERDLNLTQKSGQKIQEENDTFLNTVTKRP